MIAKTFFYVAAVSFVTGCASTVAATTEKEHVEQEVVYRPVEEVWPDVVPQKPRSNPKTPTKNSKAGKNPASKTPTYAQRRVVQVTGSAPVSGGFKTILSRGRYKVFTTSFRNTARTMLSGLPAITPTRF